MKDNTLKLTINSQPLNGVAKRETHSIEPPFKQVSRVPPGVFKTIIETLNGYYSVRLVEESEHLVTFIMPWGEYSYDHVPRVAAGDA